MKQLEIQNWDTISLEQMEQVKLMNRHDTKFYLHLSELNNVLHQVQKSYYALDINGEVLLPYSSIYFDTLDDAMYRAHHNGKLHRFKIRRREYKISGRSFLEIKIKNNKGKTLKKRIESPMHQVGFSKDDTAFIHSLTPYDTSTLKPGLLSEYHRLTLVNKEMNERCTIDMNLAFNTKGEDASLKQMAIIELKTDNSSNKSPMYKILLDLRVKPSGFSKYCIGRSMIDADLKRNSFKAKLRELHKYHGNIFESNN